MSFCPEYDDEIVYYIYGHSGCAHSDVRSLKTTIVEGPIERITASSTRDRRRVHWHIEWGGAWTGPNRCRNGRESAVRVQA